jgi:membrane fusion protein, multidrug efflux system
VARTRIEDVPVTLDAVGTVQALNTATIQPQVDGRLVKLPFNEGEDVKKDDIVAEIEPDLYKAAYDQAVAKKAQDEANLANARIDLVRYQKLAAGNYGSQQQYETQKWLVKQLEAQVASDQASVDSAKTTLGYCTIRSPINGRAGIRQIDVGNILHAASTGAILTITQLKPIYVIYTVPQQALPAVQKAQQNGAAAVTALAPDNSTVIEAGKVEVIDNSIDQTTGTARIKATFDNPQLRLWPGQFVNVRMVVGTVKNAVVVPSTAIQRGPNGAFVYAAEDGRAVMKTVAIGPQDENTAVVSHGLEKDAQVVTSGFARLSNGAQIVITAGKEGVSPVPVVAEPAVSETRPSTEGGRERGRGEHAARRERRDAGAAAPGERPSSAPRAR